MGQKGHIMVQKGLKMHEKRQKKEFLDLKTCLFSGFGGYSLQICKTSKVLTSNISISENDATTYLGGGLRRGRGDGERDPD